MTSGERMVWAAAFVASINDVERQRDEMSRWQDRLLSVSDPATLPCPDIGIGAVLDAASAVEAMRRARPAIDARYPGSGRHDAVGMLADMLSSGADR